MRRTIIAIFLVMCLIVTPVFAASTSILDMPSSHWAYKFTSYLVEQDIMPLDDGYFYPSVFTTRGEFVLALWRAAGSPEIWVVAPTFEDVDVDDEYYHAVEWAVHNNITAGTSTVTFSPDLLLTREQSFTFLWRALPQFDYSTEGLTGRYINGFVDAEHVSQWAWQSMNELCALGIVNGTDDGYLMPARDVSNAETATVLYRTLELVGRVSELIDFYIYNESEYTISSVAVMPAYSDGTGINLLPMPLEPHGFLRVQLTEAFAYAEDLDWRVFVTDTEGDTSSYYDSFSPRNLKSMDIYWDADNRGYYCSFSY